MGRVRLTSPSQETVSLNNSEETFLFGQNFANRLRPNSILALFGDLGAGKTTFVQGLARGLEIDGPVQSPTFVTLNLYEGTLPLFHFDLYRLKDGSDFFHLGFEEYFQKGGVCAIEWPDRIASRLPPETIAISFQYANEGQRAVRISNIVGLCSK